MPSHRVPILKKDQSYTFGSYFKMKFPVAEILHELGVTFEVAPIEFVKASKDLLSVAEALQTRLENRRQRVRLTSEAARREVLIAPVLLEVADITQAIVNIEYPVEVNQFLSGDLDYLLEAKHKVLVVEAKQADLTRGFTQLATELIALEQWVELSDPVLYGAITTGDIWQFGSFARDEQRITQDTMLYRVPTDLSQLMPILVGILQAE
ncbi:hypothetical protein Lepto7375DRAFT_5109 [Leptolyngbya sp. PCC 7375]|nr:hypothetical protein Lepto7375DRAFT_5109 [Leptolyngbya sp. PCC 7375]